MGENMKKTSKIGESSENSEILINRGRGYKFEVVPMD